MFFWEDADNVADQTQKEESNLSFKSLQHIRLESKIPRIKWETFWGDQSLLG